MEQSKKIVIIICAILAMISIATAIVFMMNNPAKKLSKQLKLGQKYLNEMNYEEAIAKFEKALEIDPMNVDAFLGIAHAYMGLASACYEKGNYTGAIENLEEAKARLENGINILSEYAKVEKGKGFQESRIGADIERLEYRLVEIESEIDRIKSEMIGSGTDDKVGENSKEKPVKDEAEKSEELPQVHIQPLINELNNVWGRKWTDWTLADYVSAYNLTYHEGPAWFDKENAINENERYAVTTEQGDFLYELYMFQDSKGNVPGYAFDRIEFFENSVNYTKTITSTFHEISPDGMSSFCLNNDITSPEKAAMYFGIYDIDSEFDVDSSVRVMTEYGLATAYMTMGELGKHFYISVQDGKPHPITIMFAYSSPYEIEAREFQVWISQDK